MTNILFKKKRDDFSLSNCLIADSFAGMYDHYKFLMIKIDAKIIY
ncbi:hypothetical protein BscR1v2_005920 [Bartonella schoenbuchensis R1]|uniref:Uncharacterized protein n=2 Tax=Bartonella schoenbuchensis TaxID=165694 RepID=A0A1S6XPT0_BARSR|nr:hypothetical protein BscR1v2_005920 [Bartonella schoenbuchensis R1]CDP80009.1 hypothetical protein BN1046_00918 [Bartonella schoenbuchensis]